MKRYFCMTAVILMAMLTAAGCGNAAKKEASDVKVSVESVNKLSDEELHSLFQGTWETSVVFINNQDGIKFDIDKYVFKEDGTGTFTPYGGKTEMLSWTVSPDGDLEVLFEEKGEKVRVFEYISGNLVSLEKEDAGMVETHLVKAEEQNTGKAAK